MSENIFGTAGVRGIFGKDLDHNFIYKLGAAVSEYFGAGTYLIGWDCRVTSLAIANIAVSSLLSMGNEVHVAGLITTPALQKYIQDTKIYKGGLMITASHNPPEYNGIKVIRGDGVEISRKEEVSITKIFNELDLDIKWYNVSSKVLNKEDAAITYYIESLYNHIAPAVLKRKIKLGIDYANCSSYVTIRRLVNLFHNFKLIEVNNEVNGLFPGRLPEPTPENLKKTLKLFKKYSIDLGIAFDGDGDRGIIIDENNRVYWGDEIGVLVAYYMAEDLGINAVVTPVSSSILVETVLEPIGIKVVRTRVGAKNIVSKMIELNSILGFEENGGIIYAPHLLARDGAITLIMTLNLLSKYRKSLSELRKIFPTYYQFKLKYRLPKLDPSFETEILLKIREEAKDIVRVEEIDGIKLFHSEDEWVLIRPSGTEPLIRIFTESRDKKKAKELAELYYRKIKSIASNIVTN